MSTEQILAMLIAERDRLNKAIEVLQGPARRRGRPPKNPLALAAAAVAQAPVRKQKPRTAAQKKAQSERMKKYWANRKKAAKAKS